MWECMNCGKRAISWDNDFDFEDYGVEGDGVVHVCHCMNCGAEVIYYCPTEKEKE